jgi:hypothetical protein
MLYHQSTEDMDNLTSLPSPPVTFALSCSDSDYDSVSASDTERSLINRRRRMVSESGSVLDDDDKMNFHNDLAMRSKPSCIHPPNPDELEIPTSESILGLVRNSKLKYS